MQSSVPLQPQLNHRILLINLIKSIELWFLGRDHMENEFDDLYLDIQNAIVAIILEGLQLVQVMPNSFRLQKFIMELEWLQKLHWPKSSIEENTVTQCKTTPETQTAKHFLNKWVQENLKNGCLCSCLQMLVTDMELLNTYFYEYSLIRNEKFATTLFICISAVEMNRSSLLTQIDQTLFAENLSKTKRSTSHPNLSMSPPPKRTPVKFTLEASESDSLVKTFRPRSTIRKYNSLPCLKQEVIKNRKRSQTMGNVHSLTVNISKLQKALNLQEKKRKINNLKAESLQSTSSSGYSKTTTNSTSSSSIGIELIKCDDIKIWTDQSSENIKDDKETPIVGTASLDLNCETQSQSRSSSSPINTFLSNIFSVPSFRGNSGNSWNDSFTSMCYSSPTQTDSVLNSFLPRCGEKLPLRKTSSFFEDSTTSITLGQSVGEQSLTAFLQTNHHSRNNTELERENAHFRICEAIISAIERIKCQKMESDKRTGAAQDLEGNKANPGNSSTSKEFLDYNEEYSKQQDEEIRQKVIQTVEVATESDLKEHLPYAETDQHSAENIGLSLISKFNDKHLPKVSDLKWLVSEDDTPQNLLPMPQEPNNPDDHIVPLLTRGTRYWAPPRQQIIFTNHPSPKRKTLIKAQNFRCAGCGMRVSASHIKSFRYCTYLGKYHCTGCHRNQISAIPSKVLHLWDFNFYPVSVFAYRLLEQMWTYPLFYVPDLNPALYLKAKSLRNARLKRLHTQFVKEFITTCRFAEQEQMYFASVPDYITMDPDTWSMSDLIDAKSKTMHKSLQDLIQKCEDHIFGCVLCKARGFVCEFCRSEGIIYPWQNKVGRCDQCGSCYHSNCWKDQFDCPKCQRLKSRQIQT